MLKDIIDILENYPDGKLLFDDPVTVDSVCVIHAAWAGRLNDLWLMDWAGRWHELKETDHNYSLVAKAVLDKLRPSYADAYGTAF